MAISEVLCTDLEPLGSPYENPFILTAKSGMGQRFRAVCEENEEIPVDNPVAA